MERRRSLFFASASLLLFGGIVAEERIAALDAEVRELRARLTALEQRPAELDVDRLVVRKELIVSDTGQPWEKGFEAQEIARGLVAKPVGGGVGGLWVRSRLIKTELDDPFDDRFHALERDGSRRGTPGHISWNDWVGGAWRQMAILQGEALDPSEVPPKAWTGGNHPGRLRFQTYRPDHDEPVTDAILGQGMLSLGGGGYGGEGLRVPGDVLDLWGGGVRTHRLTPPADLRVEGDDGSGRHTYAVVAVGPQGDRSAPSATVVARGRARLRWDQVHGADSYVVLRDGWEHAGPLRREGTMKRWEDDRR